MSMFPLTKKLYFARKRDQWKIGFETNWIGCEIRALMRIALIEDNVALERIVFSFVQINMVALFVCFRFYAICLEVITNLKRHTDKRNVFQYEFRF